MSYRLSFRHRLNSYSGSRLDPSQFSPDPSTNIGQPPTGQDIARCFFPGLRQARHPRPSIANSRALLPGCPISPLYIPPSTPSTLRLDCIILHHVVSHLYLIYLSSLFTYVCMYVCASYPISARRELSCIFVSIIYLPILFHFNFTLIDVQRHIQHTCCGVS